MYEARSILALIPARGGSKGLLRKNLQPLLEKPLIYWTLKEAEASRYIDRIVVSTEDEEIAVVAQTYGAEVPFVRPANLASDTVRGVEVIFHALGWFEKHQNVFDLVVLLQPTSPLRVSQDIDSAVELLFAKRARAVVSVSESEHHPCYINYLPDNGCMKDFVSYNDRNKNRQELKPAYRINGAIYLAYWDYIKDNHGFFGEKTFAYIMPEERSVDVDSRVEMELASIMLKQRERGDVIKG